MTVSALVVASAAIRCSLSARHDQQTTFGARLLDGGAHERVEQPVQDDLARHGLRHLDHGREIKVLDRRPDRARQPGSSLLRSSQTADGADRAVAPSRRPPSSGSSAGRCADRAARSARSRAPHRSAPPIHKPGLRSERSHGRAPTGWPARRAASASSSRPSRRAISAPTRVARFSKVLGAARRPGGEPFMMCGRRFEMQAPLVAGGRVAECGATKRLEELIIGPLELGRHRPKRRIAHNRREPRGEVMHEGAGLQLADRGDRMGRAMPGIRSAGGGIPGAKGAKTSCRPPRGPRRRRTGRATLSRAASE